MKKRQLVREQLSRINTATQSHHFTPGLSEVSRAIRINPAVQRSHYKGRLKQNHTARQIPHRLGEKNGGKLYCIKTSLDSTGRQYSANQLHDSMSPHSSSSVSGSEEDKAVVKTKLVRRKKAIKKKADSKATVQRVKRTASVVTGYDERVICRVCGVMVPKKELNRHRQEQHAAATVHPCVPNEARGAPCTFVAREARPGDLRRHLSRIHQLPVEEVHRVAAIVFGRPPLGVTGNQKPEGVPKKIRISTKSPPGKENPMRRKKKREQPSREATPPGNQAGPEGESLPDNPNGQRTEPGVGGLPAIEPLDRSPPPEAARLSDVDRYEYDGNRMEDAVDLHAEKTEYCGDSSRRSRWTTSGVSWPGADQLVTYGRTPKGTMREGSATTR